ncbi:inositol monophosphatase family protein [Polymorphum gilvum]|uniref:Inositol-1-monophosphatase n=1 Tax=Polymorphum gilvum (strain LMG 25793 / CGMCC 1.9160 / SL003B-26A1) TaxID=991905 RepID=F2IXI9_POLGS|nr:inositol monophosphatase [Polymorphum gilvum]ADZ71612.1 Inositol monophosphatase family protein [Polymorphum gilvum SL003B-26A1]
MPLDLDSNARHALAQTVIRQAGDLAVGYFAHLDTLVCETKQNGQDVASEADRAVEDLVRQAVCAAFPNDGFLGEEKGFATGTSGYVWIVDPIDGTSCFLHGLRDWCISLALVKDGSCELGMVCQPSTGEFFAAVAGQGAFLNGAPIGVDRAARIDAALLGMGANFRIPVVQVTAFVAELLGAGGMFIRSGSGALMLAHVACGRLAGYYEPHINVWDCMAGLLLIREAGGWTADYPGEEGWLDGGPVIACAPQLRDALTRLVERSLERAKTLGSDQGQARGDIDTYQGTGAPA